MSRTKLTPEQLERELADMLNAAHHYGLKGGVGAPFRGNECCAIGAMALAHCPVEVAKTEPYDCAALHVVGPGAIVYHGTSIAFRTNDAKDAISSIWHGNDQFPAPCAGLGDDQDLWELGYMFREAMLEEKPASVTPVAPPPEPVFTGCGG